MLSTIVCLVGNWLEAVFVVMCLVFLPLRSVTIVGIVCDGTLQSILGCGVLDSVKSVCIPLRCTEIDVCLSRGCLV